MSSDDPRTIRLHRILRAPPERVYSALTDAAAMVKWNPPRGFTGVVHEMEVRVGGTFRMSFTNFTTGTSHSFGGTFLELDPPHRIVSTDTFENASLPGTMRVTYTLKATTTGTELEIVQGPLPEGIPLEFAYLGWQESLAQLADLVEPEIPDA